MAYRDEVRVARQQFDGAVEDAAAEALRIAEEYGKPLQTVCKDIAGDAHNALRHRAIRLQKSGQTGEEAARRRTQERQRIQMAEVRAAAKRDPEAVARAVAKVDPDILVDVATEAQGRTRSKAPSNKGRVEQAFGPEEFNRLEDAIDGVLERLPDLAPNKDDKVYAQELADKAETVASILRDWAKGQNIGQEVEAWLEAK